MLIPSFKTWVSALRLSILAYLGVMVFPLFAWYLILFSVILLVASGFTSGLESLILMGFAVGALVHGFLFYLMVKFIWAMLLKLLWSRPPQWLLPTKGLRANFHRFAVLSLATLPLSIIIMPIFGTELIFEHTTEAELIEQTELVVNLIFRYFWLWLICAAYLIHWLPVDQKQRVPVRQKQQT